MKRRFFKRVYGRRRRIESAFSRYKRRLGSALAATSWAGQKREIYTRVLTHDLMLLKRQAGVFYRARR
jgi:transposase